MHARIIPNGPALSTNLSRSSPDMRTLTPPFSGPSRFSFGTNKSSKTNSPVLLPRMPSLSSLRATEKPLTYSPDEDLVGTMNDDMPLLPAFGSVFAYTMTMSASGPFVIHIFEPLIKYPPSTGVAVVVMLTTSEPALCSDMASAPTEVPATRGGRYCDAWEEVLCRRIWLIQSCEWAAYERAIEAVRRI